MKFSFVNLRAVLIFLAFIFFVSCISAYALPAWLQRGGSQAEEVEEEILKMPDFEAEQAQEQPYYHFQSERSKGPFLWIFAGFLATAFLTSL